MARTTAVCALFAIGTCAASAAGIAAEGTAPAAPARAAEPEVWICHRDPFALLGDEAGWQFVRRRVTGIKLYIDVVAKAEPAKLAALAKMLQRERIKVAIECGGTLGFAPLDDTNGEQSARIELRKIDRLYRAGGKVDYLDLDGPVRRLLYPPKGRKPFTSIDRCAAELMDYMRAVRKAHPRIRFWLLTNFPNWGYRGGVSYHARGPKRQDWGDYDKVVTAVLDHAKRAKLEFAGVTVDNPYEYAVGEHFSVKLKDPTKVDWIKRIRAYEQFARSRGLEFNLIANSEHGGKTSDRAFHDRTLKMVDAYVKAGGRPTRYVIQSWYKFPRAVVPETAPHSMTALVKAVIMRFRRAPGPANAPYRQPRASTAPPGH